MKKIIKSHKNAELATILNWIGNQLLKYLLHARLGCFPNDITSRHSLFVVVAGEHLSQNGFVFEMNQGKLFQNTLN